jgi:phosphate:Na+ symporter
MIDSVVFWKQRILAFMAVPAVSLLAAGELYAAGSPGNGPAWGTLVMGLMGGLALFLYGMEKMSGGMKRSAGNRMRTILAALTRNRVIGLLVGAFVTMVIQSSSATTVMLVSFVQAGLMSFTQSLGVILGADIGTTVTAQLIAFKLTDYALLMIAIGFGLQMFASKEAVRNAGEVILGFGILFFGMKLMSDAMSPLRSLPAFIDMMRELEHPLLGLAVGAGFTALVQSSSATTGILIVLAQQGLLTLEAGIPILFGANIGTCITAALAAIGTSREAKRVALAHVVFKVAGVLLFIFWIPAFADLVRAFGARYHFDTARQIANAHTLFNVSLGLVFLPLTGLFARLVLLIFPERKPPEGLQPVTWYLDDAMISTPAIAIDLARTEISRIAKLVHRMLSAVIIPFMSEERLIRKEDIPEEEKALLIREIPVNDEYYPQLSLMDGVHMREEKIDFLEEKIRDYLFRLAREQLDDIQAGEIYAMMSIATDLESIADIIHRNMVPLIEKKKQLEMDFSEEGKEEILIYHRKVCQQIGNLEHAFRSRDLEKARRIMHSERKYLDLEAQYRIRHLERVRHKKEESALTHEVHMELMDLLKQIIVYSSNIANTFLLKCGR